MFKKRPGLVSWSCWLRIWALPLVQQETCMAVAQLSIVLIRNCPKGIIVQKLHTSTTFGINISLTIFSMFLISDSREQFFDLPIFASFIDFLVQEDSNPGHLDNDYPCKPFCHRRLHFEQKILPEIVTKNWRQKATLPIDPEQRFFIAGVTLQGRSFNFFSSHTNVTFPTLNSFFSLNDDDDDDDDVFDVSTQVQRGDWRRPTKVWRRASPGVKKLDKNFFKAGRRRMRPFLEILKWLRRTFVADLMLVSFYWKPLLVM